MKPKSTTIKDLASYFDQELNKYLPISILPNGALGYKNFLVKQLHSGNWGVFNVQNKDMINEYHLKSCGLMAAKFYNQRFFNSCSEVKDLDNSYWRNYNDYVIFNQLLKNDPTDNFPVLLTRMEECYNRSEFFKHRISSLFKATFT